MKKNVIFILLTVVTLSMNARTPDAGHVDPLIENKFKKEFGQSIKVSWEVIQDVYVATFIEKGEVKQVYYSSEGEIWAIGKYIGKDQLPETALHSIRERFPSGVLISAYELQNK